MSRSNGPVTRRGSYHQDWQKSGDGDLPEQPSVHAHRPLEWPDLFPERQQRATSHHQTSEPDYGAYGQQPQAGGYHYPQDHYDHGHYGPDQYAYPGYPAEGGDYQPYTNPAEQQPDPYGPRFEDYLASAAAHGQRGYENDGLSQLQTGRRGHSLREQPQADDPSYWYDHDHHGRSDTQPSPHEYDLGSYMPAADNQEMPYGAPARGGQPNQQGGWRDPRGFDLSAFEAAGQRTGAAEYYEQLGSGQLPVPESGQQYGADLDDEADEYEYEEPARSRRGLMIAAALAGAIVVGGGLAYGYKAIVGPTGKDTPPVIKADTGPVKSQPDDPGGRQFAHSDSKLMGRLDGGSSTSGSARASTLDETDSGVRRVPTIVVGRDGSIAPPSTEPRLPPVPGMTIVNGFAGRSTIMPTETPQETAQVPPAQQVPAAPRIIAKAEPETPAPAVTAAATPRAEPPPVQPAPPTRSPVVRVPSAPTPTTTATRSSNPAPKQQVAAAPAKKAPVGYVAVLASQKSRIDALKTFADLQQKYSSVLQNKIPDVQEADLSARGLGTMYRVVVGPPSSREAAADLCGQLKSAGFEGCWVTAY